jgi:hypothetical protein
LSTMAATCGGWITRGSGERSKRQGAVICCTQPALGEAHIRCAKEHHPLLGAAARHQRPASRTGNSARTPSG